MIQLAQIFTDSGGYRIQKNDSGQFFIEFTNGEKRNSVGPLSEEEVKEKVIQICF
jgi:hypothetical protein